MDEVRRLRRPAGRGRRHPVRPASTLVEYGVIAREPYREPGARSGFAYRLTSAGRELQVVLSALQQWGDEHLPRPEGPSMLRRVRGTDGPVHVGYLDEEGREVPPADRRHHLGQLALAAWLLFMITKDL